MRIAFLFDNTASRPEALDLIAYSWIRGLAESQHEIKVITNAGHVPPEKLESPRITWAEAMSTWSWLEAPRLLGSLLPFAPQIIHAVLCRPLHIWQLWSMGSAMPSLRLPLVVSTGDGFGGQPRWPHVTRWLNPGAENLELPPLDITAPASSGLCNGRSVFVPGPLRAHRDWRRSLREIFATARQNPHWTWCLGWDWSEIPLAERLEWRSLASLLAPGQLEPLGSVSLEMQIGAARNASQVRLELLDPNSWIFGVLSRSLEAERTERLDAAINALTRTYLNAAK